MITSQKGMVDFTSEDNDKYEVEIQERSNGLVLYIHGPECTLVRICRIKPENLTFRDSRYDSY